MERLGDIVARVLAGVRDTMEERKAGDREGPRQAARAGGGDKAPALARDRATSRVATSSRDISSRAARRPAVEIYEHALDHGSE